MNTEPGMRDAIATVNRLIQKIRDYKQEHPETKIGYGVSFGGLLNAYREGDIRFDDCVKEMEKLKDREARQALQAIADAEPRVHRLYDGQTYEESCEGCG